MKPSKLKSSEEKKYHDYLANQRCIACGNSPVTVHHIRNFNGINVGMGKRSDHYLAISLCYECHQGQDSIHHNRKIFEMRHGDEASLLALTIERLWNGR